MTILDLPSPAVPVVGAPAPSGVRRRLLWRLPSPRTTMLRLALGLIVAAACALFAPAQLGGRAAYAVTDGVSMLPHYRAGDLVVLRARHSYHVGEVAAYHNADLGVVVLHRIVAIDGDRYVFKGDHNNFRDTFHPTAAQIVGGQWLHLSGFGRYLQVFRRPAVAALLLAVIWLLSFRPAERRPAGESRPGVGADPAPDSQASAITKRRSVSHAD